MIKRTGLAIIPLFAIIMFIISQKVDEAESHTGERPPPLPDYITPTSTSEPSFIPKLVVNIADFPSTPTPIPIPTPTVSIPIYREPSHVSSASESRAVSGVEQWRYLVIQYFGDTPNVQKVLNIMSCESGGDPNATGIYGHRGLMQELPEYHQAKADSLFGPGANLYDPEVNIAVARVISGGYNFSAWECQG